MVFVVVLLKRSSHHSELSLDRRVERRCFAQEPYHLAVVVAAAAVVVAGFAAVAVELKKGKNDGCI
jgi:hypothetical protein